MNTYCMYISKGSQGHTSYSESWGKSIVLNWYLFFIRHKIIIFDFVSFACSGRAKTPTNTSIVWLFWGLRLPPGSGLQIVKHMIHWPGASWQGPGQVTDSARQKKLHFFFSLVTCGTNPTCVSGVAISTTRTFHTRLWPCNVYTTVSWFKVQRGK